MKKLKKVRKAGSVEDALLIQWRALSAAEEALYDAGDASEVLKAVHAITQAASAYAKVSESHRLEERIAALEAAKASESLRRVA